VVGHGTHCDAAHRHDPGRDFKWNEYVGADRVVALPDYWDRDRQVTMAMIDAKYASLRGRRGAYLYRSVVIDKAAMFVGAENARLT
jgi:hypothetical protein